MEKTNKVKVVKAKDKTRKLGLVDVRKLDHDKREYAVARGTSGFKRFKVQHPDFASAEAEAKRLAKMNGGTYLVVGIVAKVYGKSRDKNGEKVE